MSSYETPEDGYTELSGPKSVSKDEDKAYTTLEVVNTRRAMPVLPPIPTSINIATAERVRASEPNGSRKFISGRCIFVLTVILAILVLANTAAVCYLLYRMESTDSVPAQEQSTETKPIVRNTTTMTSDDIRVAFYARTGELSGATDEHIVIKFDDVDLNVGDAYDCDCGKFKAPADGIYSISYEVLASDACGTDNVCVSLFVDDHVVSITCSEYAASGGAAVTLELAAKSEVWVAIHSGAPCRKIYGGSGFFNKFSGHLVSKRTLS